MKKKLTNETAVALYMMLAQASISRMQSDARCAVVRTARALRPAAEDYDGIRQDAMQRLTPEETDRTLARWMKEEREVDFPALLSADAVDALCQRNDFNTAQVILLEDSLMEEL